ncbi:MAG TPA: preQ(1) synthase [Chitinophagaceae bacterium]
MSDTKLNKPDIREQLKHSYDQALQHTSEALDYMAKFGIKPEGKLELFLSPETRQREIHRLPYVHKATQVVTYETQPGEFSALCPFSGLPDYGVLKIEYVPASYILELKSLKYYILSWRNIGAAQEDITALIYKDLMEWLGDPHYLVVTTVYNVRGGIATTCSVDSRTQTNSK